MMIEPVGQQIVALDRIFDWAGRTKNFVFCGHAGVGKTSLIPHIQDENKHE